jgi:hemolysin activation/secretion protein
VRVFVRSFRILGNTVLDPEELKAVAAPYVGREVSSEELQELRRKLTQFYVDAGYISSGVIIPDQEVADGVITLQVIEGKLSRVEVTGLQRLKHDYVRDRMVLDSERPLRLSALEERLQLLHQDRLIERLSGQLAPSERLGESILTVAVEESRPYWLAVSIDNHRSPSVGSIQGGIHAGHWNLTGWGDALELDYGLTEGLDDVFLAYSLPLSARGTTLGLEYERSGSRVIEEPFAELDIKSRFRSLALRLSHPFLLTLNRSFDLTLKLENAYSETFFLGGIPFPSEGAEDGKSEVTVIRLISDWVDRRENQVIAARSSFSWGIDAFGATISANEPDGRFFAWLGQFQWARRFGDNRNQMIFRSDIQLASDPLLSLERFAVGGAYSVRGYRENLLVRDNGVVSSLEFRFPVLRDKTGISRTQLAAFVDYGQAWNKSGDTPEPRSISSAGLGLRWDPTAYLHAELYGAVPFRKIENNDHDLQDEGLHFLLSYRLF